MRRIKLYEITRRHFEDKVLIPLMWKKVLGESLTWDELLLLMNEELAVNVKIKS